MCRRSSYRVEYNLRIVKSCPKSKDEWDRAAHDMKCNELAERGNCTSTVKQLQYHCVINSYMNETLEVCAPIRFIFGNVGHCLFIKCNQNLNGCFFYLCADQKYFFFRILH